MRLFLFATALAAAVHLAKVVTACEGLAAFKDQQPLVGGSMVASSSMKHANTYSGPPSPSGSSRFIPSALKSVLKKWSFLFSCTSFSALTRSNSR